MNNEPIDSNRAMAFPPIAGREYIWTFSGEKMFFDDPKPAVKIVDIAHALSQLCRWTGHVKEFYSVAQHCIACSKLATTRRMKLIMLLHDASEAYTNDINKPLKNLIKDRIDPIELKLETAIFEKYAIFDITEEEKKQLKRHDLAQAMAEAEYLLGQRSITHYEGARNPYKGRNEFEEACKLSYDTKMIKSEYLDVFQELM